MQVLVVANLILSATVLAAAVAASLYFYFRRRRRKQAFQLPGNPSRDYAAPVTKRGWAASLNYSSFVYLDVDRDGRYGLGDRPMGGIMVRLSGSGGHLLSSRTNGNGFANFTMSTRARKAQIRSPGTYNFVVSVPPGWTCTSANQDQSMAFDLIEGSPAGIGAPEMVKPVGIAPVRYIGGKTTEAAVALLFGRGGETLSQEDLTSNSPFPASIPDEADSVTVVGSGWRRRLLLSPYPTDLGVVSHKRPTITDEARLETIDFNAVTPRGLRKIPSGYAGLNWFNLNAISRDFTSGSEGYVNGNTSGDHMCYTSSGHPAEFWSDHPFGLHSMMLAAAWLRSEGEVCTVETWRGDEPVARDEITMSALTPVHYAPMLKDVTRVRISSRHYWQLVVDDLVVAR
jgi:hypothetical protein